MSISRGPLRLRRDTVNLIGHNGMTTFVSFLTVLFRVTYIYSHVHALESVSH